MNLAAVIPILTIGVVLYYFLLTVDKNRNSIVTWIFVAAVLLAIGWWWWSKRAKQTEKTPYENDYIDEDYTDDSVSIELPKMNYTKPKNSFTVSSTPVVGSTITYRQFKMWYLTPSFIESFLDATREAFRIKKKLLVKLKKKCVANLETIRRGTKRDGLASLMRETADQNDTKTLEATIASVDLLLQEIAIRSTTLTLDSTRRNLVSAVTDKQNGIDSLTGRDDIKDFLALQLFTFSQNPRIFFTKFQNIAIYGKAGVGKTKLAEVIGHVYASSGILVRRHVQSASKADFTTAYVNESGRMTRKLLLSNLESVVFIDEAYDMTPPAGPGGMKGIDHGHEAIAAMVNLMNDTKGLLVIIVAGYQEEMEERFMSANKGLDRRFPFRLTLTPYRSEELTDLLIRFLAESNPGLEFTQEQGDYLFSVVNYINEHTPQFIDNQAGDMDNLSGFISRAIYGTMEMNWSDDYEEIVRRGVNSFLGIKGASLHPQR